MKVGFVVVPPGGGEADYQFDVDLPALPHDGDYISVWNDTEQAHDYFIVRRRWFGLRTQTPKKMIDPRKHTFDNLVVEVEFAMGPLPTKSHADSCKMYAKRGRKVKKFEETAY